MKCCVLGASFFLWGGGVFYRFLMLFFFSLLDAISACALYASKNTANGPVMMRCIDAKLNDLLLRSDTTTPGSLLHALARTHAVILYQIMRFFDGDIIARASAEATFGALESAADALAGHITWKAQERPPPPPPPDSRDHARPESSSSLADLPTMRDAWRDWFRQESARRTYLIARFFTHLWKLLTGRRAACSSGGSSSSSSYPQRDDDGPPPAHESWTLSAHLWRARDAVEFAAAWRDRRHYVVRRKAILSTLAGAGGDDIEAFGKMLLTVALGVDEARSYLALKGGSL